MTDMGCACICGGDGERADVYEVKVVRAKRTKRPHECCECGETISPGEQYERASGLWDGSWDRYKTCMPCVRIRDDLCSCEFVYGELRETISESLGLDYVTGEISTQGWWKDRD